jgi:hypothetical protein
MSLSGDAFQEYREAIPALPRCFSHQRTLVLSKVLLAGVTRGHKGVVCQVNRAIGVFTLRLRHAGIAAPYHGFSVRPNGGTISLIEAVAFGAC